MCQKAVDEVECRKEKECLKTVRRRVSEVSVIVVTE